MRVITLLPGRHGWAAVVTWALVSGLTIYLMPRLAAPPSVGAWAVAALQLIYLVAMLVVIAEATGPIRTGPGRQAALYVQLGAALMLGWLVPISFLPIYTIVWIAIAPHLVSRRACHAWFIVLLVAWYVIQRWSWQDDDALISVLLFGTFHYFAMLSALETRRAEAAKDQAEALNRELTATQLLLAEATRQSERTRIARDLHDLLGHHLTALAINLQVAARVADGDARERIDKCHALSTQMLEDVRRTVTTLREESAVDFRRALQLVVENIPQLSIRLDIDEALSIDDVNVAEALLRCVQEAITNTLRHAGASECTIRAWREEGRLNLTVSDNGTVDSGWQSGNGLQGMRERIERLHGTIEFIARDAFEIAIQIPLPAS